MVFLLLFTSLYALAQMTLSPGGSAAQPRKLSAVPAERLAHLKRGINVSGWFAQLPNPESYTKEYLESHITPSDLALIKTMGFDHVRLSIDPKPMFRSGHADEIPAEYLDYVDAAVNKILAQGLAVMIDIQAGSDFKARLASEDSFAEQFTDFWRGLARHYSTFDPDRVFLEILNEPELFDRYRWYGIQAKVVAAIREAAPQHTIIAAGARWSADDELLFVEPLPDPNIIYNFHFYEPHVFTHQGATWGTNYWHWVKDLSYPSSRESAEAAAARMPDERERLYVLRYGMEHWDAARIEMEISRVAEWADRRKVPLTCNEFGVYRKESNPQDRANWIKDVRTSLERHGIGWTMWDYSAGFGVVNSKDGQVVPDQLTLQALGLRTEK